MLSLFFPPAAIGLLSFIAICVSTLFWGGLISLIGLFKLMPFAPWQRAVSRAAALAATQWVSTDALILRMLRALHWQVDDRLKLDPDKSYLIVCNHQSWADILILFDLFHARLPVLKFFLKQELIWVPAIGTGCWALDMPFMKRHSRAAIAKNPALARQDLETTRRACQIYQTQPAALVNFLEGTRFTEAKRRATQSPYRHLLRPKAGGLSFTLNAMGEQFGGIIDVTLGYQPTKKNPLWSWLSGEQDQMDIHLDLLPIPDEMIHGDYEADAEFRARFQNWVNGIWSRKDARLERMHSAQPLSTTRPALPY